MGDGECVEESFAGAAVVKRGWRMHLWGAMANQGREF